MDGVPQVLAGETGDKRASSDLAAFGDIVEQGKSLLPDDVYEMWRERYGEVAERPASAVAEGEEEREED